MPRSKSVPSKTHKTKEHHEIEVLGDEIEILPSIEDEKEKKAKKKKKGSSSRKSSKKRRDSEVSRPPHTSAGHHHSRGGIANRPEWNNDTHIDGYDDLDDNGKVKRRGELHTLNGEKSRQQQEEINRMWTESLRI